MNDLDILLSMVENPTRRKILESLVKEPHYPLQLSKELGISQQAVIKNLNILEKNGVVVSYQESSSIGPMRTVYEPNSEFTIVIDMRNGMFSARMVEPDNEERPVIDTESIDNARSKVKEIDRQLEELERQRSKLIRDRESLISGAMSKMDGYTQKSLMYEILNEPDRTIEQLSCDLNARRDAVENVVSEMEMKLKQTNGGVTDEQ